MLSDYNKIPKKLLFMPPHVEGVVLHLHFQVFIYVLNLFFQHDAARAFRSQHDHPNS